MPRESKGDPALIYDMRAYSRKVASFVQGRSEAEYQADEVLRMAVERAIELIGEPARYVSIPLRLAHPEVPWMLVQGQRHVLAHDYGEIINAKIWRVATMHVPKMIPQLEAILAEFPPPPTPSRSGESTQ